MWQESSATLDWAFLQGSGLDTPSPGNDTIPMFVFCAYQLMFAIITPALITGAFAKRVTFKAYLRHGLACPRLLPLRAQGLGRRASSSRWGVLDFAGGIVVHNIAGIAASA